MTAATLTRLDSTTLAHYPSITVVTPPTHQGGRTISVVIDERSDEELLNAHVLGDHQALNTLLQRYKDAHFAIAYRRIYGDKEMARDGVQEAWITISQKAASFRGESKLSTWMYQIVDRACIDLLRKTQVRPQLVDSELDVENRIEVSEDFAENSVTNIRIYEALDQLPAEQRDALIKVDMEGYSVGDAARVLGIAEGTVKSRRARGRKTLAILLADLNPETGEPISGGSRLSNSGGER